MATKATQRRSASYFLSSGDLYILAEGVTFRVHRYFFIRDSELFAKKLRPEDGYSEQKPVILETSPEKLEKLLWVFYNPNYCDYTAPREDWESILELADGWSFPEAKALALRTLDTLDMELVDRIVLYRKFHASQDVLADMLADLCAQDAILTPDEVQKLGWATVGKLLYARELLRGQAEAQGITVCPLPDTVTSDEIWGTVVDLFRLEVTV
ncbi:hypothetical protein CYLTODRAFT_399790 [Cylindrobasidium torrendii FP15055 ss-10]|uniref:BTB domain-containing protein n=1 Tax=Cylindrobasidium torrendii FP15055 ss-10 TaxID=1314674 RepID=A0A0D7B6K6_9AGAR|nr:hypothetical protein CYLTODRAFT_399790 [Cylindrobasidium torrendii FP15055 ss-10]